MTAYLTADRRARPGQPLTDTETQVLYMHANGATSPQILRLLGKSGRTYRRYLRAAEVKLGARTLPHAVALAVQQGLITVEERA